LLLVRTFLVSALLFIPASGLLGMGVLVLAGSAFPSLGANEGTWWGVAGWSLRGLYAGVGLIGGGVVGAVAASARTFSAFEASVRDLLQRWQPPSNSSSFPSLPLQQVRERYEQVIEQVYTATLGRVRLPGFLERFVRSRFRQAFVEDFLSDVERRGVSTVGLPELRHWLSVRGLPLVTAPVHAQIRIWRLVLVAAFCLLAVLPFALGLLGR
jgi:hypothetical protein